MRWCFGLITTYSSLFSFLPGAIQIYVRVCARSTLLGLTWLFRCSQLNDREYSRGRFQFVAFLQNCNPGPRIGGAAIQDQGQIRYKRKPLVALTLQKKKLPKPRRNMWKLGKWQLFVLKILWNSSIIRGNVAINSFFQCWYGKHLSKYISHQKHNFFA